MRKILVTVLGTVALMGIASLALAADATEIAKVKLDSASLGLAIIGTALGMAIAAAGCGIGQGFGLKGACEGIARNPDAAGKIQVSLILGLAFIESLAIYSLVVNLIILFANPFA
ncbi:MAG: ATP synthase F0 subunit C [Bilophila sp.]